MPYMSFMANLQAYASHVSTLAGICNTNKVVISESSSINWSALSLNNKRLNSFLGTE